MVNNILKNEKDYDVVIRGAYGAANFGDDALLFSLLKNFPKESKIAVVGKKNNYVSIIFPNIDFYSYEDNALLRTNILLWGGGTQFYDFFSFKFFLKKLQKIIFNPIFLFRRIIKKNIGVSINFDKEIYLSIGFGPFASKKKEKMWAEKLSLSNLIFVRDPLSYNNLKKFIKKDFVKITEDICLLDKKNYINSSNQSNGKICIIIRDWEYDSSSSHIDKIIDFYLKSEDKSKMDFILFASDPICVSKLKKESIPYIQWNPLKYDIKEFSNLISAYNLIISSRYHGVIFGIIHSIPTIAIEIEPKLSQVSKDYPANVLLWDKSFKKKSLNNLIYNSSTLKNNFELKADLKNLIDDIKGNCGA